MNMKGLSLSLYLTLEKKVTMILWHLEIFFGNGCCRGQSVTWRVIQQQTPHFLSTFHFPQLEHGFPKLSGSTELYVCLAKYLVF